MGDRLEYVYDFGDSWEHVVVLEGIVEPTSGAPRARLVDGDRAAPLEDCGGVPGYEDLVTALADPKKPDHTHLVEWYVDVYGRNPADFDPGHVDVDALDRAVRRVVGLTRQPAAAHDTRQRDDREQRLNAGDVRPTGGDGASGEPARR